MSFGRKYGLVFMVLGIILCAVNFFMLFNSGRYFPKLLITGFALTFFGISMLIVPGVPPADSVSDNDKMKVWFKQSPLLNKIVWIVFGLGGIGLGFYVSITLSGTI